MVCPTRSMHLGEGYDRDNVMRILKDSRIGAFGALALIVALLLKVSLLVDLGALAPGRSGSGPVLVASPCRSCSWDCSPMPEGTTPNPNHETWRGSGRVQALIAMAWSL